MAPLARQLQIQTAMSGKWTNAREARPRLDRLLGDDRHDPYRERGKLPEPTVCPDCKAVVREGRWQWLSPPFGAPEHLCPACRRTRDSYPAGQLIASGAFLAEHRDEVVGLIRNVEARNKAEHPLKRIMALEESEGELEVTTTDAHLVRAIGDAIHHAYQGELSFQQDEAETLLRMRWSR